MNTEQELVQWLNDHIPDKRANKNRDIEAVLLHYGFGDLAWPTLEQIGQELSIGTRERVRQVLKENFKTKVSITQLPTLKAALDHIHKVDLESIPNMRQKLTEEGLISANTRIRGLLNLGADLDYLAGYELVDHQLNKLTRAEAEFDEKTYVGKRTTIKALKKDLRRAKTLPGQLGLAKFKYIQEELGVDRAKLIKTFVEQNERAEFVHEEGATWYIFEDRDNTLVNWCEKISTLTSQVSVDVLSEALALSLGRRTQKYEYPGPRVIKRWILQSKWFEVNGDTVTFLGASQPLTNVETAVANYLSGKGAVKYPPLKEYLLRQGFSKPNLDKAVTKSPLVYVDRSGKRSSYTYTLISEMLVSEENASKNEDRYEKFHNRLKKLASTSGTEAPREVLARKEQGILSEWLFDGKSEERCAICQKYFAVSALITAHKKKRADCAESEKVDPNIVFPLCAFGCDHLFENGRVKIRKGVVESELNGEPKTQDEIAAVDCHGNKIEERWLRGRDYFNQR